MTTKPDKTFAYSDPFSYQLVYVYTIEASEAHRDLLKIGGTSFRSALSADAFPPNCAALNDAALKRIREQTNTAGVKPTLLYTELAIRTVVKNGVATKGVFADTDVHAVLKKSGYRRVKLSGTTAREWYRVDLDLVKKAIQAVKDGRPSLGSSEAGVADGPFPFRPEQLKAIGDTLTCFRKKTKMLWDAKMRFGKTAAALEVVRRAGFRKTLILTHRPIVGTSWSDDYKKIFRKGETPAYRYEDKSSASATGVDAKSETALSRTLRAYAQSGQHFIYFASIQNLRGSKRVGGKYLKNEAVFDMPWDLVIVDEAHEGTQTELGHELEAAVIRPKTRKLELSGTPFNIRAQYDDDSVFVWDYVMEQRAKEEWTKNHPDEPNPYAALPRMNILTFDLAREMNGYESDDFDGKAFNFTEFFRTWTGDPAADPGPLPAGAKVGDFLHESDVRKFLDLISGDSSTTRYPFATPEGRGFFRHTLWMVPGVAAGAALEALLRAHPVFGAFGIANVAGEGDAYESEHYDDALAKVREKIRAFDRTITLSCGKLTTGVTVPEWTAVLMLAGSVSTSASSYMQTIFRVQSPGEFDGRRKEECYVFDFAPDRTLTVIANVASLRRSSRPTRETAVDKQTEEARRQALSDFLNFCPVIAMDCGRARKYDVGEMMKELKHVFVLKAIRNGFDDDSIYSDRLLNLRPVDVQKFKHLMGIVGTSSGSPAPTGVVVNGLGFDEEEWERTKDGDDRKKRGEMSEEDRLRREAERRAREDKKRAISILRAISIRMPLLIYGAKVDFDAKISLDDFVTLVDDASWTEFMPRGVDKNTFRTYLEYYDRDVFESAGLEIRRLARRADDLLPTARVLHVAQIFRYFKNPDKETVLTPWRVVNLHLSDTLGGWCFYGEAFDDAKPLDAPRFVDRGAVTRRAFAADAKILEINSKSGLYPLYAAYSVYRARLGSRTEEELGAAACRALWRKVVAENVFVLCKTPMAASITRRTLLGFDAGATCRAETWEGDLVATLKDDPESFTKAVSKGSFWQRKEKDMTFNAIIGNPPYQLEIAKKQAEHNGQARRKSIFQYFQMAADSLSSGYVSLIYPGVRWLHRSGKGMEEFGLAQINDKRMFRLDFYPDSQDVFSSVEIADGITIVSKDVSKTTPGFDFVYHKDGKAETFKMANPGEELIPLNPRDGAILAKVGKVAGAKGFASLHDKVMSQKLFAIESDFVEKHPRAVKPYDGKTPLTKNEIKLFANDKAGKSGRSKWYVANRNVVGAKQELINEWKVVVSSANAGGQKRDWQLAVFDDNSAFGRSRVALRSFKTKGEAQNFYAYCKTFLVRYLFLMTAEDLTSLAKKVPDFGDYSKKSKFLDFSKDLNAQLYKIFGLTEAEVGYVEKTISDIDASRSKKPMA